MTGIGFVVFSTVKYMQHVSLLGRKRDEVHILIHFRHIVKFN